MDDAEADVEEIILLALEVKAFLLAAAAVAVIMMENAVAAAAVVAIMMENVGAEHELLDSVDYIQ